MKTFISTLLILFSGLAFAQGNPTTIAAQAGYSTSYAYSGSIAAGVVRRFQIGTTSPVGLAIYVAQANGSDTLGDGSSLKPYKTISKAVASLDPSKLGTATAFTIAIRDGVYREFVNLAVAKPKLVKNGVPVRLVIQAAPGAKVFIKGSDEVFSGWTDRGNGLFSMNYCKPNAASWKAFSPCVPVQMLFHNRRMFQQIGGVVFDGFPLNTKSAYSPTVMGLNIWPGRATGDQNTMPAYSFFYTSSFNTSGVPQGTLFLKLPVGQTPNGKSTEIASRGKWIDTGGVSNLVIMNLNFEHSNTSAQFAHGTGALNVFNSNDVVIQNVSTAFADLTCIGVSSWDLVGNKGMDPQRIQIKNSDVSYCGDVGINGWGNAITVTGNRVAANNIRAFNANWHAGGIKFAGVGGLKNSVVNSNHIFKNYGAGFWCDYCTVGGNQFKLNRVFYNKIGLHIEVSKGFTIAQNYVFGNIMNIHLRESIRNTITQNVLLYSKTWGLFAFDDFPSSRAYKVYGQCACNNTVTYNTIGFAMMQAGPAEASLMNLDWPQYNVSNYNVFINKVTSGITFPWQVQFKYGPTATNFSLATMVRDKGSVPYFTSKTGDDVSSRLVHRDPSRLFLSGETLSLKAQMDTYKHFTNAEINAYVSLAKQ